MISMAIERAIVSVSVCGREGAGVPVIAEALFNVINLNRPAQSLMTDTEFLAAVNEIMQQPRKPPIEVEQVPPYPPAEIAN